MEGLVRLLRMLAATRRAAHWLLQSVGVLVTFLKLVLRLVGVLVAIVHVVSSCPSFPRVLGVGIVGAIRTGSLLLVSLTHVMAEHVGGPGLIDSRGLLA